MAEVRAQRRLLARGLLAALLGVPLACAYPLLDGDDDERDQRARAQASSSSTAMSAALVEFAVALIPRPSPARAEPEPAPAPEPEPPPPPPPPSAEEIVALVDAAAATLVELEIKIDPRRKARGHLPAASGLPQAYAEGRALVLEGRYEQVRQWAALAKFGSRDPGTRAGQSALTRYDLLVTRDARSRQDLAYFHVVVPAAGLAPDGERGTHEAWIGDARWVNLADALEPGVDYQPFKTNGNESLHRQWGHEDMVADLVEIARQYRARTGLALGVGDLSHVTGGKIEDHWTHQQGVDVDLYLIDPALRDAHDRPRVWWSHVKRGVTSWTSEPKGKGEREPSLDAGDELSHTATSQRLEILAQIVFVFDQVAYFVHNDSRVLAPFDAQVGERRPGRRFLHAENRGYWPTHADHVHLRWVDGELPVDATPRP